jgi:hypothetical protein
MEQGARRVGRDYQVEPVKAEFGVFHPKLSLLLHDDDCHLLVGSGNLTFGGWGGNFEVCEHIHASFAADAIEDAADFFEYLSFAQGLRHGAAKHCVTAAEQLRSAARGRAHSGDFRLFHSLDGPISEKLSQAVSDLGGAERLVVAAPFWDGGTAIDRLCEAIGLDHVFVHSHAGGVVTGTLGSNWPSGCRTAVRSVRLEAMQEEAPRRLHAKVFELVCKRGRIVLSGSANATWAALEAGRNVEACIARIQRRKLVGWHFSAIDPPAPHELTDEPAADDEEDAGVLRAVLEFDQVVGQVLTPRMVGQASVFQITTARPKPLGTTDIGADGQFKVAAPGLELETWKGERLALRVQDNDNRRAEGFISVAAFAEISRRAGALAPRLMAVIAGTETPADVATIFSWFNEDPGRLADAVAERIGGASPGRMENLSDNRTISVAELDPAYAIPVASHFAVHTSEGAGWRRFMEHVFAAFRERREPFGGTPSGRLREDDEDELGNIEEPAQLDPEVGRSLEVFEQLLALMLRTENASRHAFTAFDLTHYVSDRLQPDAATIVVWLERLIETLSHIPCPAERREEVVAGILTVLGAAPRGGASLRKARTRLIRIGADLRGNAPPQTAARGFQSALPPSVAFEDLWTEVQGVRTFREQTKAYLTALERKTPSTEYVDLEQAAPTEWPILRAAFESNSARSRILVAQEGTSACPRCHRALPKIEIFKLHTVHIATATNCCGRVIVCGD